VHTFLKLLAVELNAMEDSASLRDALDACVFFSGSMGRLGADFTSQLPPLFEDKMLYIVLRHWSEGTTQLAETLKICRDAGVASPLVSTAADTTAGPEGGSIDPSGSAVMMPPPRQLMALPPLGRVVNACLIGLNELRRCLLPGIFTQLRTALEMDFLMEVKNVLHAHERAVMTPGLRGEAVNLREVAKQMKEVTKTIVFPYLRGALELSLGNDAGAKEKFDKLREFLAPPPGPEPIVEEKEEPASVGGEVKEGATTASAGSPTPPVAGAATEAMPVENPPTIESPTALEPQVDESEGAWTDEGFDNL
jgi:hypothetical protein